MIEGAGERERWREMRWEGESGRTREGPWWLGSDGKGLWTFLTDTEESSVDWRVRGTRGKEGEMKTDRRRGQSGLSRFAAFEVQD
jgi:hypothetical protein